MNRRAILASAFVALAAFSPAIAYQGIGVSPLYLYLSAGQMQFLSAAQLAAPVGLPGIPTTAKSALLAWICVETASIRYTDDGLTTPTASVGNPVVATSTTPFCFPYAGPMNNFKVILSSGSPTMDISYYYAN